MYLYAYVCFDAQEQVHTCMSDVYIRINKYILYLYTYFYLCSYVSAYKFTGIFILFHSIKGNKFELLEISTKNLFAQPKDLSEIGEDMYIICTTIGYDLQFYMLKSFGPLHPYHLTPPTLP